MIIDLVKLGISQIEFDYEIQPNEIDLESDFMKLKTVVCFKGKLNNLEARTEIDGEISTNVEIDCSRCLEPVSQKFDVSFQNAYITTENFTEEQEIELEIKDLDVSIFEGYKIDLTEIAQEQLLLAMPTQVLCKEDCQGLCEKCGANRNLKNCNCDKQEVDPRWSALKDIV